MKVYRFNAKKTDRKFNTTGREKIPVLLNSMQSHLNGKAIRSHLLQRW